MMTCGVVYLRNRTEGKIGPSQEVSPWMRAVRSCGVFKIGTISVSVGLHSDGTEVRGQLWGGGSQPGLHCTPRPVFSRVWGRSVGLSRTLSA